MGNNEAALGAGSQNPVKHRTAKKINEIKGVRVQRISPDVRKVVQKLIRNQQVVRSIRIAGSSFPNNYRTRLRAMIQPIDLGRR